MSSGTLLLSVGVLLMVSCALGGGFEIKEIKIPKIGAWSRAIAGIFGVGLLVLGLAMSPEFSSSNSGTDQASTDSSQENHTQVQDAPNNGYHQDQGGYQEQVAEVERSLPSEDPQAEYVEPSVNDLVSEGGETIDQQDNVKSTK